MNLKSIKINKIGYKWKSYMVYIRMKKKWSNVIKMIRTKVRNV